MDCTREMDNWRDPQHPLVMDCSVGQKKPSSLVISPQL